MSDASAPSCGASTPPKGFSWAWLILILILLLGISGFVVVFIFLHSIPSERMADAGFRRAKRTINPEQLRAWATKEIPKYPSLDKDVFGAPIAVSEIPDYLQKLYPLPMENAVIFRQVVNTNFDLRRIYTHSTEDAGHTNVSMTWGGPFFHWWIIVGPTNFVLPKLGNYTTVEWAPGIYYGREGAAHPFK